MIDSVIAAAPLVSRVVVVGVCMGNDAIRPSMAINKELDLLVVGYSSRSTQHLLADGKVDPKPLVTGEVGLAGVGGAFDALGDPERHPKILIDPKSAATEPAAD
jgi:threonine dehydrogenase-like Zn-dependent dehydrogenase